MSVWSYHDSDGSSVVVWVLRDDDLDIIRCYHCGSPLAEDDQDEALGLEVGKVGREHRGYPVLVCPSCHAPSPEASL